MAASLLLAFTAPLLGQPVKRNLTLELVSHPDEVVPPGPENIRWRPHTDQISFIEESSSGGPARAIWLYDATTGAKQRLLSQSQAGQKISLESYQWSPDGRRLLLEGGGDLWLFDMNTGKVRCLAHGAEPEGESAFSPRGDQVGFIAANNLYVVDLKSGHIRQLSRDGSATVLNGVQDWVYGEELAYRETKRAYEWSPDSTKIDFLQVHATLLEQRFPQPGDPNPVATLHVVNVEGGQDSAYKLHQGAEYIVPAFTWTPDSQAVCFLTLNRNQTREVMHLWSSKGDFHPLVETDPYWINNVEPPQFIDHGQHFLWLSERDGWLHLYLFSRDGKLEKQLTCGKWLIDHPVFEDIPSFQIDEKGGWAYFESTRQDPRERQIYRVRLNGMEIQQLTKQPGTHDLRLSPDGRFLVDDFSSITDPPETRLLKSDGTYLSTLDKPANHLSNYALGLTELVSIKAADGTTLYARLVRPANFNPQKKYPVIVYVYGGPHFQIVRNEWGTTSLLDQLLAEHGFLIWSLDNRGSWGRGHAFETVVFKRLGERELQDQLAGVKYLKSLPYVDGSRIGIWGWSYGGYMTLYSLTHAPQVFKCGIAGAPVTDWRFYDSIYTERYMRTPEENPEGYRESSPVRSAGNLRAKLLLIHGVADDNVHLQNTLNFIQALIEAKISYQLYLQPAQKHGFRGEVPISYRNMRIFDFFEKNL